MGLLLRGGKGKGGRQESEGKGEEKRRKGERRDHHGLQPPKVNFLVKSLLTSCYYHYYHKVWRQCK